MAMGGLLGGMGRDILGLTENHFWEDLDSLCLAAKEGNAC